MKKKLIILLAVIFMLNPLSGCVSEEDAPLASQENIEQASSFTASVSSKELAYEQAQKKEMEVVLAKQNNQKPYNQLITKTYPAKPLLDQYLTYTFYHLMSNWPSITEYDNNYPIECLRKMGENRAYTIQKTDDGGLLYSFFSGSFGGDKSGDSKGFNLMCSIYAQKVLYKKDFDSVKVGVSAELVRKIDPTSDEWMQRGGYLSKHLLKDGLIIIKYSEDSSTVKEINYYPDFIDPTAPEEYDYEYNYSILPQDYPQ